jgi:hypothetical protein
MQDVILRRMISDYMDQESESQSTDRDELAEWVGIAAVELEQRLERVGLSLPPRTRSRTDKRPYARAVPVFKIEAHPSEVMIVRAIARTWGAAQFGCSPDGSVFTADTDGYSWPDGGRRNPLVGLSPLLDDVADFFNSDWRRNGTGGRFYERGGSFFDAEDGAIFLEVDINDSVDFERTSPSGQSLWQKLIGWITG